MTTIDFHGQTPPKNDLHNFLSLLRANPQVLLCFKHYSMTFLRGRMNEFVQEDQCLCLLNSSHDLLFPVSLHKDTQSQSYISSGCGHARFPGSCYFRGCPIARPVCKVPVNVNVLDFIVYSTKLRTNCKQFSMGKSCNARYQLTRLLRGDLCVAQWQ